MHSRWNLLAQLWQDSRYGARLFRRSPVFTIVAVLTLALGIGATTAIFSVVNAVLLRPLPFPEPGRLVRVWESSHGSDDRNVVNPFNFVSWRERNRTLSGIAAIDTMPANVTGSGSPLAVPAHQVSPEFFSVLGVSPLLGRGFTHDEEVPGHDKSVILSYGFWQSHFGGDPGILGRKIMVNGGPLSVVGVMPRDFRFPKSDAVLWMPFPVNRAEAQHDGRYLSTVARLKPGVSLAQARQDLAGIAAQLSREWPAMDKDWTATVLPLLEDVTEGVRLPLLVLLAAVGLVLLIACANVANLLLMRANARLREVAVRAALGAGRRRILQQLLSESLLLAAAGCVGGLAIGYWGLRSLLALIPANTPLPRMESIHLDSGVFGFTLAVSLLTAVLFGLVPAFQLARPELQNALRQGTLRTGVGGNRAFRRIFVVTEIALALVLLVGAGLLLRSFDRLISVRPGFATDRLLTMNLFTSPAKYADDRKRAQYLDRVLDGVRAVPGVEAAGSVHFLPLTGMVSGSCFAPAPGPKPDTSSPDSEFLVISPGYFEAMRTSMLRGRGFDARDGFGSPSALVVNEAFAKHFLPGQNPIGKRFNVCWGIPNPAEVVGVVADARQRQLDIAPRPTIFLANAQAPMYFARLVVRATGDPGAISRSVESAIHQVDPEQAISDVRTMQEIFSDSVGRPRFQLVLLLVFAGLALLLSGVGVYGVISYSVSQRTQEIGIRVALGAAGAEVSRMVLREGLLVGLAGVAIGLTGALALTPILRSLLFEIQPADPPTLAAVTIFLLLVSIAAALIPARRAARIDPMAALRYD
ncbi:MAG: ABC transporter permease [Bryobacteraceae bacterium]